MAQESYECRTPEGSLNVAFRGQVPSGSMIDAELKAKVNEICNRLRDADFNLSGSRHAREAQIRRHIFTTLCIAQELRRELEIREGEIAMRTRGSLWTE